jgi:signal transduction histidine kinase/PAS domain-containing protein
MVEVLMSVHHEDTAGGSAPQDGSGSSGPGSSDGTADASPAFESRDSRPWRWLAHNSFSPQWLPTGLSQPPVGYAVAVLLQIVAAVLTALLMHSLPSFAFAGLLSILALALVALNWGAGPSVLATLSGTILLDIVVLAPRSTALFAASNDIELLLFLLVGLTFSVAATRFERTRRGAAALAASLNNERAHLEAVIDAVPDAVSIYDVRGALVRLNQPARQNMQVEPALLQHAKKDFTVRRLTGEALPPAEYPVSRALRGEILSAYELSFPGLAGENRFASISAAPLHDTRGRLDGAVVISHDITRLHLSEREAAAQANELEVIFEAMTDGIFVFNRQGRILRINAAARALFHLEQPAEFNTRRFETHGDNFTPLDERGRPLPAESWPIGRMLRGEMLAPADAVDVRLRERDGAESVMNISGAPTYDKSGAISGAVCICRDVTLLRRVERRTQETLNALLAMAEALVLAPGVSGNSGQLSTEPVAAGLRKVARRVAELTSKVLGCQRVSILAIDPESERVYPIAVVGLSQQQENHWWQEKLTAKTQLGEGLTPDQLERLRANDVLLLDAEQAPLNAWPNPFHIKDCLVAPMSVGNQIVGLLTCDYSGSAHDYTRDEIALAKAVAKLAALVIERERLLRERADARANELALREANRRLDEFLGMTSHELRTPLTSIKGNTQLTVRQLKNSLQGFQKMHDMLESTERQIKLLDRLVDDLLDISRAQADHLELDLAVCELEEVIGIAIEEQRLAWPERTISLEKSPVGLTASVSADSGRLNQVITNYLTNALKYSAAESPIRVELSQEMGHVRVAVIDKGAGLARDEQAHIWERFYRAPGIEVLSTSHSSMKGLGLGLSICKMIIEEHHGNVGVASAPGEGSTFWFTLPHMPGAAEAAEGDSRA